jgi:hypothetical protein
MRRYIIAKEWEHLFPDETVICRFVMDTQENELIDVHIRRGRRWFRATRHQLADVEDSVVHSQVDDICERYKDFGMTSCAYVPDWALGARERAARKQQRKEDRIIKRARVPTETTQLTFQNI